MFLTSSPRERLPYGWATGLVLLLGGVLTSCRRPDSPPAHLPPVRVTVAVPLRRLSSEDRVFTGQTEAVESVEVRSRVTGYLDKICFKDGAEVKQGDLLFEIDPRPFQAALDQTTSQVKLRGADVKFRTAELKRAESLLPKNAISRSDYDEIVAKHEQAAAALETAKATQRADELNVKFTKLCSPIAGVTSRTQITRGNLVQADQTVLTTVVSVDPIYVYFDLDEHTILELQEMVRNGQIHVQENQLIPVAMELGDQHGFRHHGVIDFSENRLDASTGTIRLRGVFPNPKPSTGWRDLVPGLFARVRIPIGEPRQALMIAERAIGTDQGQKCVLVVNEKNQVESRPVTLGPQEGRLRVITEGLKPSDRVIVIGMQRVRPGATVEVKLVGMEGFAHPAAAAGKADEASPPTAVVKTSDDAQKGTVPFLRPGTTPGVVAAKIGTAPGKQP